MCGNGGRCLVKFAQDMGIMRSNYKFLAIDGEHEASINMDGIISLKMKDVDSIEYHRSHFILDTGSPHYVEIMTNLLDFDVVTRGREIRYSPEFEKEGINVNFVEQDDEPDKIIVRTYERGVEDETLSCGTGVTAAALVCHHNDNGFNRVEVKTPGGHLSVEYDKIQDRYKNIWLNGPAEKVFDGTIEIY
jgi:diaminopimelate epimerase